MKGKLEAKDNDVNVNRLTVSLGSTLLESAIAS
jgi:hypothetical protein